MRFLVVDDDIGVRLLLRRTLQRGFSGAEVAEAENGLAALDYLLRSDCDLMFLDLHMPALSGLETLQAVRRSPRCASLPVLVITGDPNEFLVTQAIRLGIAGCLVKPLGFAALCERVRDLLPGAVATGGHSASTPAPPY